MKLHGEIDGNDKKWGVMCDKAASVRGWPCVIALVEIEIYPEKVLSIAIWTPYQISTIYSLLIAETDFSLHELFISRLLSVTGFWAEIIFSWQIFTV